MLITHRSALSAPITSSVTGRRHRARRKWIFRIWLSVISERMSFRRWFGNSPLVQLLRTINSILHTSSMTPSQNLQNCHVRLCSGTPRNSPACYQSCGRTIRMLCAWERSTRARRAGHIRAGGRIFCPAKLGSERHYVRRRVKSLKHRTSRLPIFTACGCGRIRIHQGASHGRRASLRGAETYLFTSSTKTRRTEHCARRRCSNQRSRRRDPARWGLVAVISLFRFQARSF
jgi:hypothetical protein